MLLLRLVDLGCGLLAGAGSAWAWHAARPGLAAMLALPAAIMLGRALWPGRSWSR